MSGGYRKYLMHLLPRISSYPGIDHIVCTLPSSVTFDEVSNRSTVVEYVHHTSRNIVNFGSHLYLRNLLDKWNPDVVFVPVERPFHYRRAPVVTMLQNMEPMVIPYSNNPVKEKVKNYYRARSAKTALKKADRVIAISKFVREYFIHELKIQSEKIGLIYHGIEQSIGYATKPGLIPDNYGKFLFTAGSIRPARGLEDLINGLRYLVEKNIAIPNVVISGYTEPVMVSYQEKLKQKIHRYNLSNKIIWTGALSESEMAWCYRNCYCFLMTSHVEACPNIVLEAMANGCVCIASDASPMPEFFENSALYYQRNNPKILSEVLQKTLLLDQYNRSTISELAKKRSLQYSWDLCAEKTVTELEIALKEFSQKG